MNEELPHNTPLPQSVTTSKKKWVFPLIISLVVIGLGSGAYFAYMRGYIFSSNKNTNQLVVNGVTNSQNNTVVNESGLSTQENYENQYGQIQELQDALFVYFSYHQTYPTSLDLLRIGMLSLESDCTLAVSTNSADLQKFKDVVSGLATDGTYCDAFAPKNYSRGEWKYGIDSWEKLATNDVYTKTPYSYSTSANDYQLVFTIRYYPGIDDISRALFVEGKNTASSENQSSEATQKMFSDFVQNTNTSINSNQNSTLGDDLDNDGLSFSQEVDQYKTKPDISDSDQDGLNDGVEILVCKSNPNLTDSDGDGFSDLDEAKNGYNVNGAGAAADTACQTTAKLL